MGYRLVPISKADRESIINIFNHYVENSFAAYMDTKVPPEFFDMIMSMARGYPVVVAKDKGGKVLGFGLLRPHNPMPAFLEVVEITYFLSPEVTGKGIGKSILEHLIKEAKGMGITSILASISSLNEGSIAFHRNNGFEECGRFKGIGKKRGRSFDVVWMQRKI